MMDQALLTDLKNLLRKHEGMRLRPYQDSAQKLTIGVGRNLSDNGISKAECEFLLQNDIDYFFSWLTRTYSWFENLVPARQVALVDMCFNLGTTRFSNFTNMLAALEKGDYISAASEMLLSNWARQVGDRAKEDSAMIRNGEFQS